MHPAAPSARVGEDRAGKVRGARLGRGGCVEWEVGGLGGWEGWGWGESHTGEEEEEEKESCMGVTNRIRMDLCSSHFAT